MNESPDPRAGPGTVLAVVGASGGAGTTTLVAAVGAAAVARGRSCAVVDLQRAGGGLDVPYAVEHLPGVRWSSLTDVEGPVDGPALVHRLPSAAGVRVLAHNRDAVPVPAAEACVEVITSLRCVLDLVVLDAPRSLPTVLLRQVHTAAVVAATGVLELSALAATGRRVAASVDETFVVLRGRRPSAAVRDEVTRALDLPVLAWLRDDPRVSRNLARGHGPARDGPVSEVAHLLVRATLERSRAVAS